MPLLNELTPLSKKATKILEGFLGKLSKSADTEEGCRNVYIEPKELLTLSIQDVFCSNPKIKSVSLSLTKKTYWDLMRCPEYVFFYEKGENGEVQYYVGEYINHDFGFHSHFLSIFEDKVETFDRLRQKVISKDCERFLNNLVKEGYMEEEAISDWENTRLSQE